MSKKRYEKKSFESATPKDTSVCIYESMLISDAFMDLSKNQRLLYIYVKKQFWSKNRPPKHSEEERERFGDCSVYFNIDLAVQYGLYKATNRKGFYDDMQALIDHGFLECLVRAKNQFGKNIYKLSDKWQKWKTEHMAVEKTIQPKFKTRVEKTIQATPIACRENYTSNPKNEHMAVEKTIQAKSPKMTREKFINSDFTRLCDIAPVEKTIQA